MPLTMPHSPTAGRMTGPGEKPAPRGYFPMVPGRRIFSDRKGRDFLDGQRAG